MPCHFLSLRFSKIHTPHPLPLFVNTIPSRLRRWWLKVPFRHVTAVVLACYLIGDQFPFSDFPMYSNFDTEADVYFVTDQNDQPLAMKRTFKTPSSGTKKRFKKELGKIVNPSGRDTKEAKPDELARAGKIVLNSLVEDVRLAAVPEGTTAFRLYRRTFRMENDTPSDDKPELLAEQPVPPRKS